MYIYHCTIRRCFVTIIMYDILIKDSVIIKTGRNQMHKDTVSSNQCKICGKLFSSLGDMELHLTIEHMQKGDIVSDNSL